MNKTELIDKIAAGAEITKAQAKAALEATTNALKEALIAGDKIQLVGFGTFSINERPANKGVEIGTYPKTAGASYTENVTLGTIYADLGMTDKDEKAEVYVDGARPLSWPRSPRAMTTRLPT